MRRARAGQADHDDRRRAGRSSRISGRRRTRSSTSRRAVSSRIVRWWIASRPSGPRPVSASTAAIIASSRARKPGSPKSSAPRAVARFREHRVGVESDVERRDVVERGALPRRRGAAARRSSMRIGPVTACSRRSSRFVALRTSPSSQRVSQKFSACVLGSSCSCACRYASSGTPVFGVDRERELAQPDRFERRGRSASASARAATASVPPASVDDLARAAARAARRRGRASSAGGTSPRTSPRSRARSSRPGRSASPRSSAAGRRISRIAVHTSWPSFIAATVASCTYCTASRMRSHSRAHRARPAHRSVVAEQQQLGFEVDDSLHRLDECGRAAHAVAAHRHEVGEVAEQARRTCCRRARCGRRGATPRASRSSRRRAR